MSTILRTLALMLALLVAGGALAQQPFKLGYVSLDRIIRDSLPAKAAQARLEQEFSKRERDLQAQGAAIKSRAEQLERDAPAMSESQRQTRQRELVDMDRDFQRKRREFQEDLGKRRNEELQAVFERANRVVRQVAEAEKYDLILQEAVYISPRHDITDQVIKILNSGASGAGK